MRLRIQIIIALVIIIALIIVVNMIRKKALELRYALAWLGVGFGVLVLDLFPGLMQWLAILMGIELPINMLFFLGFCFALIIIFGLTLAVSRMSIRIKELSQELALFEKKQREKMEEEKMEEEK
ncbi:DUF2304 domain-containing protein [Bariatricus sp. SGI.154]|uniref:DUF2304 domain-containing protein n=1 Tax=Bariatricus sp. SGI.154 TaxID=3420549 RepID=UPI003D078194